MMKKIQYKKPEIEITRFEFSEQVMNPIPGGNDGDDGNEYETGINASDPDSGNFPFSWM